MKKFIQENSLFLVVALTITILSLLKVAKAHAQGNVQALPSKTLDQIYKKDPATPVVTITKQTPSTPTRVVEAKPAPSEPVYTAPVYRDPSSCGIHTGTLPDGRKNFTMDRSADGFRLVFVELNGVKPRGGVWRFNPSWETIKPNYYAELISNGASGWSFVNKYGVRVNVGEVKNLWFNNHPSNIIEELVVENTQRQFFVFLLDANFNAAYDIHWGENNLDPCYIRLTNQNRVKLK